MNSFNDLTVATVVTQGQAASQPNHVVRLGELQAYIAALFTGAWSSSTNYVAGQLATQNGSLYVAKINNINYPPSTSGTQWGLLAAGGAAAYVYIAYATDNIGTGFTTTFDSSKTYMAVLTSNVPIGSLTAENFTGLWMNVQGPAGTNGSNGSNGTNGTNGTSAYVYIAYASDNIGTGFSMTPNSSLGYVAFLVSSTVISSPNAGNFTGLWVPYKGSNGTNGTNGTNGSNGSNGAAGANAYGYIAYASDTNGTNFSLTPSSALGFVAFLMSSTVLSPPMASNFAGKWVSFQGPAGPAGTAGTFTNGTVSIRSDGIYIQNSTTSLWHKLSVSGSPVAVLAIEQTGVS
jgi:hypothetical protein